MDEVPEPVWIKDKLDRRYARWLAIKDALRYGLGDTFRMLRSYREREVFFSRLRRDAELREAVHLSDEAKHRRGYGVTSSGYVVGSAGDFI